MQMCDTLCVCVCLCVDVFGCKRNRSNARPSAQVRGDTPVTVPVGEELGKQEMSVFRCPTNAKLGSPSVSALF